MCRLKKVVIRPLQEHETHHATTWAISEGWNPGLADATVFNAADPGSLITADIGGKPVGVISAVRMSETFGFVSFLVLAPEYRRSTYGWRLVQASFERMQDRTIGGDILPERVRVYDQYGFRPYYYTISYSGVANPRPRDWIKGVERASLTPLAELARYDRESVGVDRTPFLREWLALPASEAFVFKRDGRLSGMGMARRCHEGVRIGPLQASDPEAAEALFDALTACFPNEQVSIDCPETNPHAAVLFLKKKMAVKEKNIRVYRGESPKDKPGRVYGQMSFALG